MIGYPRNRVERFYSPPPLRRLQEQNLEQKPKPSASSEAERVEMDQPQASLAVCPAQPTPQPSNLDNFLVSTTPMVPAQYFSKTAVKEWRASESECHPFFSLGDLWESYKEWSAYGAGVPLVLNGGESVIQYYVPYLSAMQLYVDPSHASVRLRRLGDESDAESLRDSSSDCDSDPEKRLQHMGEGQNHVVSNVQRLSLSDNGEISSLDFQHLEQDSPYSREPLADKVALLASKHPRLKTLRSCDLLPSSWISVAWYPIYRIPTGPTLKDLDACFLTYHNLSTPFTSGTTSTSTLYQAERSSMLALPIFGLATYKFKGSIWIPNGVYERQKADVLLRAAENWLQLLHVDHPDFRFFVTRSSYRR
ncbi:hypothetical protein H6P81_004062 [Aristolochia fimbriata]|uniref:Uncharacterized protein n=1 Tax=Aristolochia fimbriata TaxID=158543 RepID=A0AAV7FEU6_ARIFI|nr:hypothetical protein H6P81_004062 [Aristolochia fimbriata]